ncbi:sugar ABC transporter ATP-binding protein [Sorangium cellulosum]|nr:sugar ABC transporter ATP-binding protein [Sorangium cellulosum]
MTETVSPPLLELRAVSKHYGGVTALSGVDFACEAGKVHAILGENGAGKSTLIKIIGGVVKPSAGELLVRGEPVRFDHPLDANAVGIACVFQELSLMPTLTVAENIGITMPTSRLGLFDRKAQVRRAEELLARVGCEGVNPNVWVSDLPLSRRQMVEIAKALGQNPRLLILDEATSALTSSDVKKVYQLLSELKAQGVGMLYISHRMHEIKELADVMSVFRNGRHIETFARGRHSDDQIVELMIGRDMGHVFPPKPAARSAPATLLEVRDMSWERQLDNVSFKLGKGEILGVGGLDGQGQRELLLGLFGVLKDVRGEIKMDGKPIQLTSPRQAKDRAHGIALVPEDRKTEGLMLPMAIAANMSLASLDRFTSGVVLDREREAARVDEMVRRIQIKVGSLDHPVSSLSGGNQQKVVLAKWLMTEPRLLMLNDPTRGIDVGTKQEIYQLLRDLADAGTSILFYSTDYDELIGCCDRVLVFYQNRVQGELVGPDITEKNILDLAFGLRGGPERAKPGAERAQSEAR